MSIIKSVLIFILAGFFEIGGGYLIWLWLKEGKPGWYGVLGGLMLAFYGIVATWQTANFAKVYTAYGGVFIVMALLWAFLVDKYTPDKYDILGVVVILVGIYIIYYAPKS